MSSILPRCPIVVSQFGKNLGVYFMMTVPEQSHANPAAASGRVEFVDALRGFALFGLLVVHSIQHFGAGFNGPTSEPWSVVIHTIFAGKAFAIFALLFGFGFATIMANQRSRGIDFTGRFVWRLVLLLLIGTLHSLIYSGDILQVLALMGFLLIPLDRVRSNLVLLAIAALCFLQIPLLAQALLAHWGSAFAGSVPYVVAGPASQALTEGSFLDVTLYNATGGLAGKWSFNWSTGRVSEIAGLFVVGVVLQRTGMFARLSQERHLALKAVTIGGLVLAMTILFGKPLLPTSSAAGEFAIWPFSARWIYEQWFGLALITIQIGILALLWNSSAQFLVGIFKLPGRMTLSLYVLHSVLAAPFFYEYGLGMWDDLSPPNAVFAAIIFFALQIAFAKWWYAQYRYGPLEWTWRAATLTDWKVPMRNHPQSA
ncbi:DUF418 domain-containing protein [Altererythrobacter sp. GH1-8]|uniref:DUF418 domain-containing protein n=1 Tax=Altererythrobacter sp. GH1-8 TaxID=3349333 RepID=UPI00374C9428